MTFVVHIDANVIQFQCPSCGFELQQTIGLLKAEQRMVCVGCNVAINIDSVRLVVAAEALHAAVLPGPNEITIKFFR
jgi:predicted RNA-binding Zn-ribbon protein involved in translation (DUF1610 family)